MPVRERLGEPEPKRCKHCDESTHSPGADASGASWRVTLDEDLVQTLSAILPEWFPRAPAGRAMAAAPPAPPAGRASPPKATVDASPLQQAMDRNKQSLKVKLMTRRPINQLVAQGIIPPLKTSPAFHEQRKQLERAKTGDLLKAKIQKRPNRQELEMRHILVPQEGHADPSLAEKQRMLKRARLADQLNDQLSHRPGPLELIQKNILHTEEPIERAVKEGLVPFKATCEGALRRPEHPSSYHTVDEDSPAEDASPPLRLVLSPAPEVMPVPPAPVVPATAPAMHFHAVSLDFCQPALLPLVPSPVSVASSASSASTLSPLSSAASPPAPVTPRPVPSPLHVAQSQMHRTDAPGKDKNRKKSKSKSAPKARTIKFHEYKGPPNAQKSSSPPGMAGAQETSYGLLLRQQQLLLQWQLEGQHMYPQLILPAPHKYPHMVASPAPSMAPDSPESSASSVHVHLHQIPTPPPAPPPPPSRLEDMKVSDLKAELKRRNLPVSGAKPHLIERLRPFLADSASSHVSEESQDRLSNSVESLNRLIQSPVTSPESQHDAMDVESQPATPQPPSQAVQSQSVDLQKKIEELQRELHKSNLQLQQIRAQAPSSGRQEPPQDNKKLTMHHLQAKLQKNQLALHFQQLQALQASQGRGGAAAEKRQQEHREFQSRQSPGPVLTASQATPSAAVQPAPASIVVQEPPRYVLSPKPVVPEQLLQIISTQAGGEGLKMQFTLKDGFNGLNGLNGINGKKNVGLVLNGVKVVPITILPPNPPPQYEEATRNKPPPPPPPLPPPPPPPPAHSPDPAIQSQTVDDVLEILIKNGELPPSAAQIPQANLCQDVMNQNSNFGNVNNLQVDSMNQNDDRNELLSQTELQNNIQEILNQNQIHNSMHSEFLNQNSPHSDIHNDLLSDRDLHDNLINQTMMLNRHGSLLDQSSPHEHINENSILDDLINENSMESVHRDSMRGSLLGHQHNPDFRDISDLSNSHMPNLKDDDMSNHSNIFRDEDMSNDQSQNLHFEALSNRCLNESDSNMFKSDILSQDCISRQINHCDLESNQQGRMDDNYNIDQLLGEDANDGLDFELDLEGIESMDFGTTECSVVHQSSAGGEAMDMDEWVESMFLQSNQQCDPLLGGPPRTPRGAPPSRPSPHLSWDKLDFAAT